MHFFMITAAVARKVGFPYSFQGSQCPRGYVWERRVSNNQCLCPGCVEMRRLKAAAKYAEDPTKFVEACRRYRERNPEKGAEMAKAYRENKRDRYLALRKEWYAENRQRLIAQQIGYRKANPERYKAYERTTYLNNREKRIEKARTRALYQAQRTPKWFDEFDRFVAQECYHVAEGRREATGLTWHVDHMLPLKGKRVSGLHCGLNLQVIPGYLNALKRNHRVFDEPDDWLCALL